MFKVALCRAVAGVAILLHGTSAQAAGERFAWQGPADLPAGSVIDDAERPATLPNARATAGGLRLPDARIRSNARSSSDGVGQRRVLRSIPLGSGMAGGLASSAGGAGGNARSYVTIRPTTQGHTSYCSFPQQIVNLNGRQSVRATVKVTQVSTDLSSSVHDRTVSLAPGGWETLGCRVRSFDSAGSPQVRYTYEITRAELGQ